MQKIKKVIKWSLLVGLSVVILTVVALWLFFPVEKAKQYAIDKGEALLERKITIETASVSFWGGIGVQLGDVTINNPEGFTDTVFLEAKSFDVKLEILPLLSGNFSVDRLIIQEPQINLLKRDDGSNNYTFPKLDEKAPAEIAEQVSPEAKTAVAVVTFDNIEIEHGNLSYIDDSTQTKFMMNKFSLQSSLSHSFEQKYLSSGTVSIASLIFDNEMKLPEVMIHLEYEAEYDQVAKSITVDNTKLDVNNIQTVINGTIENLFTSKEMNLSIKSENAKIKELLSFVPKEKTDLLAQYSLDGSLDMSFDVQSSSSGLAYFGTVLLRDLDVSHSEIPGKLFCTEVLVDVKENNLRFNIKEGEFDGKPIKGYLTVDNFDDPFINGAFAGSMNLKYLEPFLPVEKKHVIAGDADFNIKTSGKISDLANLSFNGEVEAEHVSYNSSFMVEPIDSMSLHIYFDNDIISIKKLSATTKSGRFTLDGRITSLLQYLMADSIDVKKINPTIDASLNGSLKLSMLQELLPPKGNPELTGDLKVNLKLSGSLNNYALFKPFGEVTIANGSYNDALLPEKINQFDAQLSIQPDTIFVTNLFAKFETSDANFKGKLIDPFPFLFPIKNLDRTKYKKPNFVFTFYSNRFDIDKLFPEAVPGVGEDNATASLDSVSTVILPDIDGRGTFTIDTLIYSKVELTNLQGSVKIEDKKIDCYDVNGNVYSGKVNGNTTIDLNDFRNPLYVGTFNAVQIEVNDFATRFSHFDNILFGKVDINGTYSASGWEPKQFRKTLTMNSSTSMRQGKVLLSKDIYEKSNLFFKKFDSTLQKEQTIQNLFTYINVKDGNVIFDKLTSKLGKIGDIEFGGFYNFDGKISYNGKIKISKELSQNISAKIPNFSTDSFTLPLQIDGTLDKPEFKSFDLTNLFKGTTDNLLKGIINKIGK